MIIKSILLCGMFYIIVMCAFMAGNMLTGYIIPWLDETTDKLTRIGLVILLTFIIAFFSVFAYGVATDDPSFVGVMKGE